MKKLTILVCLLFLSACSVALHTYRFEEKGKIIQEIGPARIHVRVSNMPPDKFKRATGSVLEDKGMSVSFIEDPGAADLRIQIARAPFHTLPQEWLTGLSFGIIPSWGKRDSKFVYRFENADAYVTVRVDETTYNHALFMPFCLLQLPFMSETAVYKEALSRYVNTQSPPPPDR